MSPRYWLLASLFVCSSQSLAPLHSKVAWTMHAEVPASSGLVVPKVGAPMPEGKRPDWFHVPAPGGPDSRYSAVKESVRELKLATVCEEAQCPNIGECWNGGTGTIMVLGDTCTRGCRFCAVKTDSEPPPPDEQEPWNTAEAISRWGVDYVVITSVDRDDLADGGASHFAQTVSLAKFMKPDLKLECLVSDFAGNMEAVHIVATSPLDVYAHNLETVERLQPFVRDRRATYQQSLAVLAEAKRAREDAIAAYHASPPSSSESSAAEPPLPQAPKPLYTKTSLMLGLGETPGEVTQAMADLRSAGVDILTLGQYLRPTLNHLAVHEYVTPEAFEAYKEEALAMGFSYVAAGPLVRSSYRAGEFFLEHMLKDPNSKPAPAPPRTHQERAVATSAASRASDQRNDENGSDLRSLLLSI